MRCGQVISLGRKTFQTTAKIGASTNAAVMIDIQPSQPRRAAVELAAIRARTTAAPVIARCVEAGAVKPGSLPADFVGDALCGRLGFAETGQRQRIGFEFA